MPDLHPIVIDPLEYKFKCVIYTCSGKGLCKDGYYYDPHATKLLPPKDHKSGNKNDIERKPVGWWKAQCAFRGLSQSGSIADLQSRLREAKKKIMPELKTAESKLNKDFEKQNAIARDGSWKELKTAEEKAEANPQKYLSEAFPSASTGRPANLDIVIVKTNHRAALADAADKMGLCSVSVDAPWVDNIRPSPDRWIVVGRSRDAVWNQMREIEQATARSRDSITKSKEISTPKSSVSKTAVPPKLSESKPPGGRTKQTARKSAPSTGTHDDLFADDDDDGDEDNSEQPAAKRARISASGSRPISYATDTAVPWDVRGSYVIECPEIEDEWGEKDSDLTLDIYIERKRGRQQMFAMFNFIVVEGIMRFEAPVPVPRPQSERVKRKREDSYLDEDGDVLMNDISQYDANNYREGAFFLGANEKPTARRPTWRYRWRGEETGEGEIQLGSDRRLESITFSKSGMELSGTFKCDFAGKCNFTGLKVTSRPRNSQIDPEAEWVSRSEAAYEYAREARWR
ncbi:hypothetical protein NHQ30_004542 [Ciborinia camelliae]|nr:hypothetical protein NHQ30_004542 [Ciborinia camelliae]